MLIVIGLIPALVKILREYGKLLAFRRKWTDVHLQGKEMGWISVQEAPGFANWGEKRLKDFILRTGLSSSLDFSAEPANSGTGTGRRGRSGRHLQISPYAFAEEDVGLEVDILSLFTIVYVIHPCLLLGLLNMYRLSDTQRLAFLIEDRDIILEQLEIAETNYILSFRMTTPDPSLLDLNTAPAGETDGIGYISRPRMLSGSTARRVCALYLFGILHLLRLSSTRVAGGEGVATLPMGLLLSRRRLMLHLPVTISLAYVG